MRTSDCDLIIVPGMGNSGEEHWQTRWEQKLNSAYRINQLNWEQPVKTIWVNAVIEAIKNTKRPCVIVAHSMGVLASVAAMQQVKNSNLTGAFLVAPAGKAYVISTETIDHAFAEISHESLPVPSMLIASHSDPYCPFLDAEEMAFAWGSKFVDAGESGHLNVESGHGPWPEGLMQFAAFMGKL